MRLDLSIGQRLAIGFALMIAVLGALLFRVSETHRASARAQTAYARHILPLAERANTLERSLYQIAIRLRNFLLAPTDAERAAYLAAVSDVRDALRALEDLPKHDVGQKLYRDAALPVAAYLLEAEQAAQARRSGPLREGAERELGRARQEAVDAIRGFSDYHAGAARAALAGMSAARDQVTRDLQIAAITALACLLLVAWLTTRAVSVPTRELLQVARGFETGLWKPALAWAPQNGQAGGAVQARDEMTRLRCALGAAAAALEKREARLYGDGQVAAATASSLDAAEIGEAALLAVVEQVHAELAVLYVRDAGSDTLQPLATYSFENDLPVVAIGEGIPGEAAKRRQPVVVRDVPHDTPMTVKLGIDQVVPRTVAAFPVLFRQDLVGVLLLASLHDLGEADIAFLRAAAAQLGIGLRNTSAHAEVRRLLDKVRDQNAEIQAQNEEIQAQDDEIRSQNEQLREHTEELRLRTRGLTETDEHKNRFLGVLAHELRNPVSAAANAVAVIRESAGASGTARAAVELIDRQVRHINVLIDDLTDVSRVAQAKLRVECAPVNLTQVVSECLGDQEPVLRGRGLELVRRLVDAPLHISGDATRLSQMLTNLLANAAKFSEAGQRVTVTLARDEQLSQAVLEVADEGAGVDPAFLPLIFRPFAQAPATLSKTTGLGLGLALVKALAELHGGAVSAHSEGPGKGARFVVRLPLRRHAQAEPAGTMDLEIAVTRHDHG